MLYSRPVVRSVLAVLAGYFLILIWVMTSHTIVWWITGPEFAFEEGTRVETLPWILISLLFWLIGGVCGGFVSALIARHPINLPSWVLAVFVLGMSIYSGIAYLRSGPPEMPEGLDPTSIDAAQFGIKPDWFPFVMAVLVAGGVVAGGLLFGNQSDGEIEFTEDGRLSE